MFPLVEEPMFLEKVTSLKKEKKKYIFLVRSEVLKKKKKISFFQEAEKKNAISTEEPL